MFDYGDETAVHQRLVREALEPHLGKALEFQTWHRGESYTTSARLRRLRCVCKSSIGAVGAAGISASRL